MKKMYYAITTSMHFQKTVLVPVEEVEDVDEAIELVDEAVQNCSIDLLGSDAECKTYPSRDSACELSSDEVAHYEVVRRDSDEI